MFIIHFALFITIMLVKVLAVPPAICREEFRWDDCGLEPKPVMYYWKKGSRCEIGLWKGCLPNPNMFPNEYECSYTCIFQGNALRKDTEQDKFNETSDEEINPTEGSDSGSDSGDTTDGQNVTKSDDNQPTSGSDTPAEGTTSGSDTTGGEPSGSGTTGGEPSGSDTTGGEPSGSGTTGGEPSGSDTTGGEPSGTDSPGEGTDANSTPEPPPAQSTSE